MKTIFVSGLFPNRNKAFFSMLCKKFRVITYKNCGFACTIENPYVSLENIIPTAQSRPSLETHLYHFYEALRFTEDQLKLLLPEGSDIKIHQDEFLELHKETSELSADTHLFRQLLEKQKIDMVIVCADYDALKRRPIAIEARRHNIPTLCVEHGSYISYLAREIYKNDRCFYLEYASEFVNLDNKLEVEVATSLFHDGKPGKDSSFLTLGTPLDQNAQFGFSSQEARQRLKLSEEKFVLTLMGTWHGSRNMSTLVRAEVDYVNFLTSFVKGFSEFSRNQEIELIFKLHPTHSEPKLLQEIKKAWASLTNKYGLSMGLVLTDQLDEVLCASDLVVSPFHSSVLWNTVINKIPSILMPLDWLLNYFDDPKKMIETNPVFKRECIQVVFEHQELWQRVEKFMDPQYRQEYDQKIDSLIKDYDLSFEQPEVKSERICNWIENKLNT